MRVHSTKQWQLSKGIVGLTLIMSLLCSSCPVTAFYTPSSSRRTVVSISIPIRSSNTNNDIENNAVYDADKVEAQAKKKQAMETRREKVKQNSVTDKDDPEWKFFDTARIHVSGGDGGNGCVAFRREKGAPLGGPSGGRGGTGGNIVLVCDETLNTLAPLRNKVHHRGKKARNGIGKNKDGQKGKSIIVKVPPGTVIRELTTQKVAGELRQDGDTLLVARGGRGGRGNAAFMTPRKTNPKLAEHGEPGAKRWLSVELRLVADVGFLGVPNAGKSTLLAAASAARPKIANYAFTTIVPNLGVCDLGEEGAGLVLCDIPGLIEGAAEGSGLGPAFLRHVQRCKVLLHVVDGTSDDPIGDYATINKELLAYDEFLAQKPQVVVLNKIDAISEERQIELMGQLREVADHSRVLSISAATTKNVKELMGRLKKFVASQPQADLPLASEIDFNIAALDTDSDDFEIQSDPAYPGQWRIMGDYIEQVARMTHWEYPEAVERFGRQLEALGIAVELERRGAFPGDLVMVDEFDFEFAPGLTNPYLPSELLDEDEMYQNGKIDKEGIIAEEVQWRPFEQGGFLDEDAEELSEFNEDGDWDLLDDEGFDEEDFEYEEDEIWTA